MLAVAAALGAGTLAGCGGAPEPVPTGEVAPGTTVTPARYMAMVREAVAAATRAELAARQISAARLDDQRLEDQRREIGPLYVGFAAALRKAAQGAAAGDVPAMREAVSQAAVQAGRIHEASAPGGS